MPGVTVGVYPGQQTAGTQVSSSGEGRTITAREDELIHPFIADGFVNHGDPVVICDAGVPTTFGNVVGVAHIDGITAATEVTVDTEGLWNLLVYAENDLGTSAIEFGDPLYIRAGSLTGAATGDGTGDAEISKINDSATQIFFGYAFGSMVAGGSGQIAVKVHAAPWPEQEERRWHTVLTGTLGDHRTAVFAAGTSEGLFYRDQRVTGLQTGALYGKGSWMELAAGFTSNGSLLVADDLGIYDAGATIVGDARVVMSQKMAILASTPDSFHWWRLNLAAPGGSATAIIAAANPTSIAYAAGESGTGVVGTVPLFNAVGPGILYVDLHAGSA